MFSLWALYLSIPSGDKAIELDAQTKIAYEWYSPFFNNQPSVSWDFSVPRTPYNEELLLKISQNGVLYPLNEGYRLAYFRGLPWQQDNEIDNGRLYVVKISTTRIYLQFKQINSILEKLRQHTCRSLRINDIPPNLLNSATGENTSAEYYLAYGESTRAAGTDKLTPDNAIVAISLNELLNQIINFGANLPSTTHLLTLTKDKLVILPEHHNLFNGRILKNALRAIEYLPKNLLSAEEHSIAGEDSITIDSSSYVTLPADIFLSTLLESILYARCSTLSIRERLNATPIVTYISPTHSTNTYRRFGELSTFEWCTMYLPKPLNSEKIYASPTSPYGHTLRYNEPLPLAFYPISANVGVSGIPIRFYNRSTLLHFFPIIADQSTYPDSSKALLTIYKASGRTVIGKIMLNVYNPVERREISIGWSANSHLGFSYYSVLIQACEETYLYSGLEGKWLWLGSARHKHLKIEKRNNVTEHDLIFELGHIVFQQFIPAKKVDVTCDNAKLYLHLYNRKSGRTREAFLTNDPDPISYDPQLWLILEPELYYMRRNRNTLKIGYGVLDGDPVEPHLPDDEISLQPISHNSPLLSPELGHYPPSELILPKNEYIIPTKIHYYDEPNQKRIKTDKSQDYVFGEGVVSVYTRPPVPTVSVAPPSSNSTNKLYLRTMKTVSTFVDAGNFGDPLRTSIYKISQSYDLMHCSENPATIQATYIRAYYEQLALAIEGDLETWDEEAIFAALYEHPYPSRDASQRIGQQRIKKISLVLRKHECSIKSVRVVQFNEIATDYDKKLAYDNEM